MSWGAQLFCNRTQNSLPIAKPNLGIVDIEDSGDPNSRTLLEFVDAELENILIDKPTQSPRPNSFQYGSNHLGQV
jgi:hypothetical protein